MNVVALIGGLLLILVGANALTDGAASVAKRFNISSLVIGLTIVAFGTSAPELTVSIVSALKGSADMAIGNVVGSNIFNTLMIVGCTAAIVPIGMNKGTLSKEIPLCILASVVLFICGNDVLINGAAENTISSSDGMLLLCFFAIFLSYTFAIAHNGKDGRRQSDKADAGMEICTVYRRRTGRTGLRRAVLCGRGFGHCTQPGSQRIYYRFDTGRRGDFPAGACHIGSCRAEEESGDGDRKCDRLQPVQYILCTGL